MPRSIDITGQKYGDLTVLNRAGSGKRGTKWLCSCACGKETTAYTADLQHDGRVSCGCRQKISVFGHDLWTAARDAELTAHWGTGLSTARIGVAMGITKNSVVGRAHRLDLPTRASPIRTRDPNRQPAPRRVGARTLPPLRSQSEMVAAVAIAPVAPRPVAPRIGRGVGCCWPIGEPRTAAFRFCDAEATYGKPYCANHCAVAYTRTPEVSTFMPLATGLRA